MKKIIWISSYPKSGNTWMRFLISNYFFNIENEFNFQIADKNILMFPQLSLMKKIVDKKFGMKTHKGKGKFFRSGKARQWKDILNVSQIKKIENACRQGMKELNYL